MATGFVLNIPQTMLERLDEADRKIAQLEKTARKTADSVVKSFLQMKSAGIDALVTSLSSANQALAQFGNTKLPKGGLVVVTQEAAKSADKVNELTNAIAKMQTIKVSNGALERVNYEIEQAIKRLAELQTKLNFFAQGEGSKSIGINTAGWENEAEGLMQRISALIEERTEIQKNTKARYIAAQQQASIDKQWYEMERQRIAAIKENARIENELAKQRVHNYVSGDRDDRKEEQIRLADQQKMYERLFGKIARLEEKLTALYNKQNKAAQESIETSKREWSERVSIWEQGFDEMERLARENAEKQSQIARENTARYIAEEQEKEKYTRERVKMLNDLALQQEAGWAAQNQEAKLSGLNVRADYNAQIKAYEQMFDEIERKRRENVKREQDAADAQAAINKKHAQQVIDDYNRQVDAARRSYEERQRMYEQLFSQRTPEELISSRGQAKTLSELQRYAKEIEGAMANLDPASQEWEKLNDIYKQTNRELKNINDSMKDIEGKHKSLINTADQVRRAFALMFSVSQVTGYINRMIQVRGELELQQRSLQAILQNKEEANKLWDKTVALAVKSPFQIKELVTYTKQLAAYRVESSKLYDTTKMLADISAGLGVDMQRLILAYGQVKAANYLRGTELRQFSEAGINILGELAKYFSELEGSAVSVGEVFDRVSRRMVRFEDVEEIFKRLTSAGGTFYRMQEIQAETLRGQISNLQDSLTVMFNEIGMANEGPLKSAVSVIRAIVENWETVATALKAVIALMAIYQVQVMTTARVNLVLAQRYNIVNSATVQQLKLSQLLQVSLRRLIASLKTVGGTFAKAFTMNPYILAVVGLVAAITSLVRWGKRLQENAIEVANAHDEEIAKVKSLTKEYYNLQRAKDAGDPLVIQSGKADKDAKTTLANLQQLAAEQGMITVDVGLEASSEEIAKAIATIEEQLIYKAAFGKALALQIQNQFDAVEWGGVLGDNLMTDLEQLQSAYSAFDETLSTRLTAAQNEIAANYEKLTAAARKYYAELNAGQKPNETEQEYMERRIKLLGKINAEMSSQDPYTRNTTYILRNYRSILDAEYQLGQLTSRRQAVTKELAKAVKEVKENMGIDEDTILTELQKQAIVAEITAMPEFSKFGSAVEEYVRTNLAEGFQVPLLFTPKSEAQENEEWIKNTTTAVAKINKRIQEKAKEAGITMALLPTPQKGADKQAFIDQIQPFLDEAAREYVEGQTMYNDADKKRTEILKGEETAINALINKSVKKTDSDKKANDVLGEQLRLLKGVVDKSEELSKILPQQKVAEALQGLYGAEWSKHLQTLGVDLDAFITAYFENSESAVLGVYDNIRKATKDKVEQTKVDVAKTEFKIDLQIGASEQTLDDLKQRIEGKFEEYDLWLDLQKLGFSPEIAQSMFGLDTISLDALKAAIEGSKDQFDDLAEEGTEAYAEYAAKVTELEKKAQFERLQTYVAYAKKSIGERAKIKFEELQHLQNIEKTFAAKEGETDAARLKRETTMAAAKEGVRKEAAEKIAKLNWEEFQQTETFLSIMGDLENASSAALTTMIEQLTTYKDQWTELPLENVKQIVDWLNKLRDAQVEAANPFKESRTLRAKINADGRTYGQAQEDLILAEQAIEKDEELLSMIEQINHARLMGVSAEEQLADYGQAYADIIALSDPQLKQMEDRLKGQVAKNTNIVKGSKEHLQLIQQLNKLYKKQGEHYQAINNLATDLYGAFEELYDVFGGDSDGIGKAFADMGMSMMTAVLNTLALQVQLKSAEVEADTLAAKMNAAAGVIGWIVMAVQLLAAALSAAFKAHDQGLENQIERLTDYVENLQKQYERLEQAIDDAFNTSQMRSYTEQLKSTANAQISYLRAMIALEEDKKNTDEDRIKEWEDEIESLGDSLAEALQNAVSKATAGILDDTFSVARDFVDAWYDSFQEVGDGISGLEDNFQEMFLNLIKQQATLQIAGEFIDRWKKYLEAYVNKEDLILTTEEAKKWAAQVKEEIPDLSLMLENLFGVFGEGVTDLTEKSSLSGLQKGISSITEETAQILEAYLNSVRFYVADSNSKLAQLVATWANPEIENPMLTNLKIIAKQTTDIHTLLESLTAPHPTESGRGLKVII